MKPDNKTWEDRLIDEQTEKLEKWGLQWNEDDWKDFISNELATQKKQIIEEENKKHLKIYKWLLGYTDFPDCSRPPYYKWRTELRKKLPNDIIESLEGEA